MINSSLRTNTRISNKKWLGKLQYVLFAFAMIILLIYSLIQITVEVNIPLILLAASIFSMFSFKNIPNLQLLQRVIILYIIEMLFYNLSEQFFHIYSLSIPPTLIILAILAIAFICYELNSVKRPPVKKRVLLISVALAFGIVMFHMLVLFLLLKKFYGYGYEHVPGILLNMWLCFLVFIFSWNQLSDINLRRIAAIVSSVFFIIVIIQMF